VRRESPEHGMSLDVTDRSSIRARVPAVLTFMFRSRFEADGNFIAKGRRHHDAPGSSQRGPAGPESKASAFKQASRMAPYRPG